MDIKRVSVEHQGEDLMEIWEGEGQRDQDFNVMNVDKGRKWGEVF